MNEKTGWVFFIDLSRKYRYDVNVDMYKEKEIYGTICKRQGVL